MATDEPQPAPALTYERSGSQYATRRQFRVLLALVVLNLLITLGRRGTIHGQLNDDGTLGLKPSTGTTVGSRWYPSELSTQPAAE